MKGWEVVPGEAVGLVHPFVDAHTLGVASVAQLLEDCGIRAEIAGEAVCRAAENPADPKAFEELRLWIVGQGINHLGFSYRLDPQSGFEAFERLVGMLRSERLLVESGGPIRFLAFAGLPAACALVSHMMGDRVSVFRGDESPSETLARFGVPTGLLPEELAEAEEYDSDRLAFGKQVLEADLPNLVIPVDRSGYASFGTRHDSLVARLDHGQLHDLPPLMRAHVGPYRPDRKEAIGEFLDWSRQLASSGLLDVLSIGSSQLTQAEFGEDWGDKPNGGGIPIQNESEFRAVYEASRPMLVRTYAGTTRIPELARMHEATINIAWHALSFWWFSKMDGRGPLDTRENLRQHFETLGVIAKAGKPFEPNIPHHFAFRGADDITYVASAVLAARCAKRLGIRTFVLQNMLNTPRSTSGLQDIVKSRAMLSLVRELEEDHFRVVLQPRAGLDYFSPEKERAKIQLAAVSALMNDIEPTESRSPEVIHVVSFSEGYELADPCVVDESIRITRATIKEHRKRRNDGTIANPRDYADIRDRTKNLMQDVRVLLAGMEAAIPNLYSPEGLYAAFWAGFLPVPALWECREEFEHAVSWRTRPKNGSVQVVDDMNRPIPIQDRLRTATANLTAASSKRGPTTLIGGMKQ